MYHTSLHNASEITKSFWFFKFFLDFITLIRQSFFGFEENFPHLFRYLVKKFLYKLYDVKKENRASTYIGTTLFSLIPGFFIFSGLCHILFDTSSNLILP